MNETLAEILKVAGASIIAYLIGSISSAVIVTRVFEKKDVRSMGSGNAGATNVTRVFGWGAGIATFVLDIIKTIVAMLLGRLIGGEVGYMAAGTACLVGHCFPLWFGFRGGKGITVGATIGFMLSPWMFLMLLAVFAVVVAITRRVSAASICCAVAFPITEYIVGEREPYRLALGVFIMVLVIFMHRANIKRLINGTEPKFKAGGKKKDKSENDK